MSRRRPTALRRTMWPYYESSMLPIDVMRASVDDQVFEPLVDVQGGYFHQPAPGTWPNRHERRRAAALLRRAK